MNLKEMRLSCRKRMINIWKNWKNWQKRKKGKLGHNYGYSNLVPFKEIFRYNFGSKLFIKNIVGNVLLYMPFGLFVSAYLDNKKIFPIFILALISSVSIEFVQLAIGRVFDVDDVILNVLGGILGFILYKILSKIIPEKLKKNWIFNIIIIILILVLVRFLVP